VALFVQLIFFFSQLNVNKSTNTNTDRYCLRSIFNKLVFFKSIDPINSGVLSV